ncbi:Hypothetical protein, putative, partial [Bodo saltans]
MKRVGRVLTSSSYTQIAYLAAVQNRTTTSWLAAENATKRKSSHQVNRRGTPHVQNRTKDPKRKSRQRGLPSAPDYSLPLYMPKTKKINFLELKKWLPEKEAESIRKWLTSDMWYEKILRGCPTSQRPMFKNNIPQMDVEKIINAGVMSVVPSDAPPSKAFVQMKSVNEGAKGRRRLILETRCINRQIKKNKWRFMEKLHLPTHREIEMAARQAKSIESIDFRSFFYQIELSPNIRKFFRIIVNGVLYELNVLPMGSVFSTFVAQKISQSVAEKLAKETDIASMAYVDNIYFFSKVLLQEKRATACFLPEIGTHVVGTEVEVLGRIFNLEDMTLRVTEKMKEKIEQDEERDHSNITARNFLEMWGRVMFVSQILHHPMANHFHAMKELAHMCSSVVRGTIDFEDRIGKQKHFVTLLAEAKKWVNQKNRMKECSNVSCTVISDSSSTTSAFIIVDEDHMTIKAWENSTKEHINIQEASAAKKGIWEAWSQGKEKIKWITDSQVVKYVVN